MMPSRPVACLPPCFAIAALLLCSCEGEPTLDGSSDEAFRTSLARITRDLPAEEKERIGRAVLAEAFNSALIAGGSPDAMRQSMDGLTVEELLVRLDQREQERHEKAAEQAAAEILELEERRRAADEARKKLNAFEVLSSRFYWRDGQ